MMLIPEKAEKKRNFETAISKLAISASDMNVQDSTPNELNEAKSMQMKGASKNKIKEFYYLNQNINMVAKPNKDKELHQLRQKNAE